MAFVIQAIALLVKLAQLLAPMFAKSLTAAGRIAQTGVCKTNAIERAVKAKWQMRKSGNAAQINNARLYDCNSVDADACDRLRVSDGYRRN